VFARALELLADENDLIGDENEPVLSRKLSFMVLKALRDVDPKGLLGHPTREAENLPDPESTEVQPHEAKRPDYQWIHDDRSVSDARFALRSLCIECKRLGRPTSSGWKLNENYVNHGIDRFRSPEWKYGFGVKDGAMIGFVQNMEFEEILSEINDLLPSISTISLSSSGWQPGGLSWLNSNLQRSFRPNEFALTHLWIDLRRIEVSELTSSS